MPKLILHPTEASQWYALLNDAQASCALMLEEDLESYLVFLLMRFSQSHQLANSILAMDFLQANEQLGTRRIDLLQELGDKSLLFSGLFPGIAEKRMVTIEYFVNMGQRAYFTIADIGETKGAELFETLGHHFIELKTVLAEIKMV